MLAIRNKYPVEHLRSWIDDDQHIELLYDFMVMSRYATMMAAEAGMAVSAVSAAGIEHDAGAMIDGATEKVLWLMHVVYALGCRDGEKRQSTSEGA